MNEVSYILYSPPILNTTNQYIERREGQEMDGWPWNPEEQGKMYSFPDCLFSNGCLAKSNSSYTVVTHWREPVLFYSTVSLHCFTSLLCLKSVVDTDEYIFLKNKIWKQERHWKHFRATQEILTTSKWYWSHLYSLFCNRITFIVDENVDVPFEYFYIHISLNCSVVFKTYIYETNSFIKSFFMYTEIWKYLHPE